MLNEEELIKVAAILELKRNDVREAREVLREAQEEQMRTHQEIVTYLVREGEYSFLSINTARLRQVANRRSHT